MPTRNILILFGFILVAFSWKEEKSQDANQKIRFDFTIQPEGNDYVSIHGMLFNDTKDTIYFLSTTCDGMHFSLQYDTTIFLLDRGIACYTNYPYKAKIPPLGKTDFSAVFSFRDNKKAEKIKLGFDFYSVPNDFDRNTVKWDDVHNRKTSEKNIIWAEPKKIIRK